LIASLLEERLAVKEYRSSFKEKLDMQAKRGCSKAYNFEGETV
jgi:hypothetical protein